MRSPYLTRIRKKIGHDLLLLPSVSILVFDPARRVLLARHRDNNVWGTPGGMVEPDESPAEAAVREMKEETGCEVKLTAILGAYGGPEFRVRYPNGDEVGYVMAAYQAEIVTGQPKPDGKEIVELAYFSYEEAQALHTGAWLPVVLKDVYGGLK